MPTITAKISCKRCPVIVGFNTAGQAVLIPCGQWSCPKCARILARRWARRVRLHIAQNDTGWWFITLTFGSEYRSPERAFAALPKLWDSLRKEMQRKYPDWQFMAFIEGQAKTRGGMPHFHIVSNHHPPSALAKNGTYTKRGMHDWAHRRGFGFQADAKPVLDDEAAQYVSKYASKGDPRMPKKFRRVRASQAWTKLPPRPDAKLIAPFKGETLVAFLVRAADATNLSIEALYERWSEAQKELERANKPPDD